jgi:hypothetical protein
MKCFGTHLIKAEAATNGGCHTLIVSIIHSVTRMRRFARRSSCSPSPPGLTDAEPSSDPFPETTRQIFSFGGHCKARHQVALDYPLSNPNAASSSTTAFLLSLRVLNLSRSISRSYLAATSRSYAFGIFRTFEALRAGSIGCLEPNWSSCIQF